MIDDPISEQIIGACIEVHRHLGPGLLEAHYEECLCYELRVRDLAVQRQLVVPVVYKGMLLDCNYRLDLVVEDRVVVELKSVDALDSVHVAQLMSYLKLTPFEIGLLVNFNVTLLKHGLRRIAHKKISSASQLPSSL